MSLAHLTTETRNSLTVNIDTKSTLDILRLINDEDHIVADVVKTQISQIAKIVDIVFEKLQCGGRLIYVGCGTSGRLGIIDAVECSVTYGVPVGKIIGVIAGGVEALQKSVENLEDDENLGIEDIKKLNLQQNDVVIGIAASGRTPYVLGAIKYANYLKCPTAAIVCNENTLMKNEAKITVTLLVGPEVITGSTRMKAGTAQKIALNMISTASMIKLGKCYGNLMIDVKASACYKLKDRSKRIFMELTGCSESESEYALTICNWELKTAVLMKLKNLDDPETARRYLHESDGQLKLALELKDIKNQY